jgi:hypothetical protein
VYSFFTPWKTVYDTFKKSIIIGVRYKTVV